MEIQRDFSVPDNFSDVTFIVDGKKVHLSRVFLGTMSPMFKNMLTKDFAESKMTEIPLIGPPGVVLKHEEFLELMHVIHPPHADVNASNYEYLLSLGQFYDIALVFYIVDKFLAFQDKDHSLVPLNKKIVAADKYDKLVETKKMVLNDFKKVGMARDLMKGPEFATLSDGMKARLLQNVMTANEFFEEKKLKSFECKQCGENISTHRLVYHVVYKTNYIGNSCTSVYCSYCGKQTNKL